MWKLTRPKLNNQHPSRFHRRQRNYTPAVEASITIAIHGDTYGIAIAIYSRGQRVARVFRLLRPSEVSSPERAWYRGFLLAQVLVDEIAPGARLLIAEPQRERRAA
ncbi:MAG: hypothetical protein AB1631_28930 [Acidobacteriota bacterium]